jgi:hypothetical protein
MDKKVIEVFDNNKKDIVALYANWYTTQYIIAN